MQKIHSGLMMVLALTLVAGFTGCKSRKATGTGTGDLAGVGTTAIGEGEMSGDRFDGAEKKGMFTPVLFAYDSSTVDGSENSKIDQVASYMSSNSGAQIVVEGNCDERGSNEYNLALGERRALAVRAALVGKGADGSRIQTKSLGEEQPVAQGHDEAAWSQNRRAEFVLVQ